MVRTPRAVLLIVSILITLLAACGVEGGDDASSRVADTTSTTPERPSSDTTENPGETPDDTTADVPDNAMDMLVEYYTNVGFTEEEANCLAEQTAGQMDTFDPTDTSALTDMFNQCDIPMSRLNEVTGDLGGGDLTETVKNSLVLGLQAAGLSDEQAECVAQAYVDEFGTDTSMAGDFSALSEFFSDCDVDVGSFGN